MEQIRRESVEVYQMGQQSAGSKDVEGGAPADLHSAAAAAAAVSDSAVESIFQVKQVEAEFVSVFPMSPDPKYAEGEDAAAAAVVAVAAAASEPAVGLIHFDR